MKNLKVKYLKWSDIPFEPRERQYNVDPQTANQIIIKKSFPNFQRILVLKAGTYQFPEPIKSYTTLKGQSFVFARGSTFITGGLTIAGHSKNIKLKDLTFCD